MHMVGFLMVVGCPALCSKLRLSEKEMMAQGRKAADLAKPKEELLEN
jgi:hypothetical protein